MSLSECSHQIFYAEYVFNSGDLSKPRSQLHDMFYSEVLVVSKRNTQKLSANICRCVHGVADGGGEAFGFQKQCRCIKSSSDSSLTSGTSVINI
jgi:hypothetical protein